MKCLKKIGAAFIVLLASSLTQTKNIFEKGWNWAKKHPTEATAIAAGTAFVGYHGGKGIHQAYSEKKAERAKQKEKQAWKAKQTQSVKNFEYSNENFAKLEAHKEYAKKMKQKREVEAERIKQELETQKRAEKAEADRKLKQQELTAQKEALESQLGGLESQIASTKEEQERLSQESTNKRNLASDLLVKMIKKERPFMLSNEQYAARSKDPIAAEQKEQKMKRDIKELKKQSNQLYSQSSQAAQQAGDLKTKAANLVFKRRQAASAIDKIQQQLQALQK